MIGSGSSSSFFPMTMMIMIVIIYSPFCQTRAAIIRLHRILDSVRFTHSISGRHYRGRYKQSILWRCVRGSNLAFMWTFVYMYVCMYV